MIRPSTARTAARTAAVIVIAASSAAAAAEDRVTPPLVFTGEVGDGLWAYGQVNKGFLVHDDGQATLVHPLVDNANSSTRAGIWWRQPAADDFVFSVNVEAEWNPYSTGRVNRLNDDYVDWSQWRLRRADAIFEIDWLGTIWLGQGSSASDSSTERDMSGTSLVAYSSVADSAGGQLLALSGGGLSGVRIGSAFSNLDGLGRLVRVRYDTPTWEGLGLQASIGRDEINDSEDVEWDVAAVYRRGTEALDISAGLAFSRQDGTRNRVGGSASVLHGASGISVTLAAGGQEGAGGQEPVFGYAKLGWQGSVIDAGRTFVSVDGYLGSDFAAAGSDSLTFGLAAVQQVPAWQTEFYATLRWFDYDDPAASYESALSFLTGARFKF